MQVGSICLQTNEKRSSRQTRFLYREPISTHARRIALQAECEG